jgi:hypothetical protein
VVEQAMAPKTAPKKEKAPGGVSAPVVSAADIAKAKEATADEKARKREISNMMYWLQKSGSKAAFIASPVAARKEFFLNWFADKFSKGDTTSSGSKVIGTSKTDGHEYEWVSKHQPVQTLGKEKAEARAASGKMATRPDPITGASEEWSIEYKSFKDVGSEMEKESHNHRIEVEVAVKNEAAKAKAMGDWFAARLHEAGHEGSSSPGVCITKEPSEAEAKVDKHKTAQKKLNKTIETLTIDSRKILKVIGETVITLKCMFQSTLEIRYTENLNEDIGKLLPRFKMDFKGVESLATKSSIDVETFAGTDDGEAVIRAMAVKLEGNFEKHNELCDWHSKFVPNNSKKQRK